MLVPLAVLGLIVLGAVAYLVSRRAEGLPSPDSAEYRATVRRFYRGLAALEVGLLDDAIAEFEGATELVPSEPASWANLGVSWLRRGEADAAAAPLEQARALAPASSEIALLQGVLEGLRGQLDEGIVHLQQAVDLGPGSVRPRFALAQALERAGGQDGDAQAQRLLEEILDLQPDNLAVLLERARIAAKRGEAEVLRDSVAQLGERSTRWPVMATEQFGALEQAAEADDFMQAATTIAVLRNVLVRVPVFRDGLAAVQIPAELIGEPLERFLTLPAPSFSASPPDAALTFLPEPLDTDPAWDTVLAVPLNGTDPPAMFVANGRELRRIDMAGSPVPFPGGASAAPPTTNGLLCLDWNNDFRTDLVLAGRGGLRLLIQTADGAFVDATADAVADGAVMDGDYFGAWAADVEMDGDLDIVVGLTDGAPVVLRNNGDGTWHALQPFTGLVGLRAFAWGDLDKDGDPDAAFLDAGGGLHLFTNQQAGAFTPWPGPGGLGTLNALTLGDVNADGLLDLVTLAGSGVISRVTAIGDRWDQERIAVWSDMPSGSAAGTHRVLLADLDNNGALDLVGSGLIGTGIWLANEQTIFRALAAAPDAEIFGAIDEDGDGQLDLAGLSQRQPVWMRGRSERGYHWQVVRPRAQRAAGDQRINSFGVGGQIELRSGLMVQQQVLAGVPVHFGLGARTDVDVVRVMWPNGVTQAEFDLDVDQVIVAEQRLKGSCPWVFAYDGTRLSFVTDFLWRSPLGLRINAQDTASVTQTEDWVRIRSDQLMPRDGYYDVRITAELWETHFFDHVSLMVVDHPEDVEVWVDERFAPEAPALAVYTTEPPRPVARAWDELGRDVSDLVEAQDGRFLATFERGAYQGVTGDHYVEFELGREISAEKPLWLLAHGWVYPTDSSINVAISQGRHPAPRGLALEVQDDTGQWVVVHPDLGFPAGKSKTIVVDLRGAPGAGLERRLRLRTNLEVYWDWLGYAAGAWAPVHTMRLRPATVELGYRGFSHTSQDGPRGLEVPRYYGVSNTTQRWRNLVGYYTRYGDVRELLAETDDRYVIMNAGDEMRFRFPAPSPPEPGQRRDFVLIGDGWIKDGDYNTRFSKTVRPLPSHDQPEYEKTSDGFDLEDDPVYRRYPDDWRHYHTRFITPGRFLNGLRPRTP